MRGNEREGEEKEKKRKMEKKERGSRDRFWSIFQKAKASTFFRERHVTGSENAAARFWRAAVCSVPRREGRGKRERKEA